MHAYVDGAMPPDRRSEVERFLAVNEDAARRVAGFTAQRAALRAALAPIAAEAIPPELDLARLIEQHRRPTASSSFSGWRAAAAAVLILGVGGAGGWSLREATQPLPSGIVSNDLYTGRQMSDRVVFTGLGAAGRMRLAAAGDVVQGLRMKFLSPAVP